MGPWKISLVSKGAIFHFHDSGRKGIGSLMLIGDSDFHWTSTAFSDMQRSAGKCFGRLPRSFKDLDRIGPIDSAKYKDLLGSG